MVMLAHGMGCTTDHGDMAIGDARRGQLTRRPLLDLIPMLMLMLIMATGEVIEDGDGEDTTDHGDMVTGDAKKRSTDEAPESGPNADASADADAWYGYYGYARPWGWGGYYRPWGYGYWGRKKRSTDDKETAAGPSADADADAWYGYYGYARPWGWGGYYRPW